MMRVNLLGLSPWGKIVFPKSFLTLALGAKQPSVPTSVQKLLCVCLVFSQHVLLRVFRAYVLVGAGPLGQTSFPLTVLRGTESNRDK